MGIGGRPGQCRASRRSRARARKPLLGKMGRFVGPVTVRTLLLLQSILKLSGIEGLL